MHMHPSKLTVWTEAAVSITEAQFTCPKGKKIEIYQLQWDRPLVFKAPHDVTEYNLRTILEHNGRLLSPGTAWFNRPYYFGLHGECANFVCKLHGDAEWRIPGSLHLVKFKHITKKPTSIAEKEWTVRHALAVILDTVDAAAKRIQSAWRRCIADPAYAVAQKRLQHEYHELQVTSATAC